MHSDLELGLDLTAGVGTLPLDPAAVGAAFRAHELTWTTPAALQWLAHQEPPERRPEYASAAASTAPNAGPPSETADRTGLSDRQRGPGREAARSGGRRFGKLAKHSAPSEPAAVQLSLFD